jgi:hypothetical protein
MDSVTEQSAVEFTKMWCNLFVGDRPDVERAMAYFADEAAIVIPGVPYRLRRSEDQEEIAFSHLVDGRGHVHFWQVLEPHVVIAGNMAVVTYYARYNVGRLRESVIKCAKETLVLARDGAAWRIVHLHNSGAS